MVFDIISQIASRAVMGLESLVVYYGEDPDTQNVIDWIQGEWLECCGLNGPYDWQSNVYFNCSNTIGCGVPFSCCKLPTLARHCPLVSILMFHRLSSLVLTLARPLRPESFHHQY